MIKADGAKLSQVEKRFRSLPRELKNDLRRYQRSEVGPIWREETKANIGANNISQKVFKSGNTVKAGASITLRASGSKKKLSGTGVASDLILAAEFGAKRQNAYTKYNRRSPKGTSHTVLRRASRQSPAYRRGGYVIYPASSKAIKRITSLSVQTVMKKIHDSVEGS